MSILNTVSKIATKLLIKESQNVAKSAVRAQIKKHAGKYLNKIISKNETQIAAEVRERLEFDTIYFKVDKNKVVFKNSPALAREWIVNSPTTKDRLIRDQETGQLYYDNILLDNNKLNELIDEYIKVTDIKSAAVTATFKGALKTIDPSDITSINFAKVFDGWISNQTPTIDSWLDNCFGSVIETDLDYSKVIFKKWIVGAARRAIKPGSSLDGCLTFQGPAGVGKTRFFREILPPPFDTRTGEIYCNIKSPQKFVESIIGKTIACFDELSVLKNAGVEDNFKQLLSSQNVDVRLAWRRDPQRYALRQGFGATSNPEKFITDPALCRRLWTIKLNDSGRLNFDFVNENRFKLWQEAVFLAKSDFPVHLSFEEQKDVEKYNQQFVI